MEANYCKLFEYKEELKKMVSIFHEKKQQNSGTMKVKL